MKEARRAYTDMCMLLAIRVEIAFDVCVRCLSVSKHMKEITSHAV